MQRVKEDSRIHRIVRFTEKSTLGVPLGKFRITIRLAGQRSHTELEGNLYDATSRFLNQLLVSDFKYFVCDEISSSNPAVKDIINVTPIYEDTVQEGESQREFEFVSDPHTAESNDSAIQTVDLNKHFEASLDDAVKAFRSLPISEVCRVLILEQDFTSTKHIILQFGRLHPLTDYASVPDELSRGFIRGQRGVECVVNGEGLSLPTKHELPDELGEGYIHWLVPDDPVWDSGLDVTALRAASVLCQILPWIHHDLEAKELKKALEGVLKSKDESLGEMGNNVKATSVELDADDRVFAAFRRHSNKEDTRVKKTDFMDFVCYAFPTVMFWGVGWGVGEVVGSMAGLFLGLIVGAWFSYRRR
jgi:hypothetical protein